LKKPFSVTVVTGTRAEFGLLLPVIKRLDAGGTAQPLTAVTGAHLSDALGRTEREIEAAGIVPDARIDIGAGDSSVPFVESTARALSGFYGYFLERRPNAALVLGDRYETFAAALAAVSAGVPVAHISGGETTEGARDEYYRHCITKMSGLHFTSCEAYRRRVIQLGEAPDTVFNAGSLGAENIKNLPLLERDELSRALGFDCSRPYLLVTCHPETLSVRPAAEAVGELLAALDSLGARAIITKSNADEGADEINAALERYAAGNGRVLLADSLGALLYLSAMKHCAAVVGNSSSGIVETPSFKKPAVDIGGRQKGRISGANTIRCGFERGSIKASI